MSIGNCDTCTSTDKITEFSIDKIISILKKNKKRSICKGFVVHENKLNEFKSLFKKNDFPEINSSFMSYKGLPIYSYITNEEKNNIIYRLISNPKDANNYIILVYNEDYLKLFGREIKRVYKEFK